MARTWQSGCQVVGINEYQLQIGKSKSPRLRLSIRIGDLGFFLDWDNINVNTCFEDSCRSQVCYSSINAILVKTELDYGNRKATSYSTAVHAEIRWTWRLSLHRGLHWLQLPERIEYKLVPLYLSERTTSTDIECRQRLRSPDYRAFPVDGSGTWNSLPMDVQWSPSLPVLKQRLEK